MKTLRRIASLRPATMLVVVVVLGGLSVLPVTSTADPSLNQLNHQLGTEQARQSHLEGTLASLTGLIASLSSQISLVESREATMNSELAHDRAVLAATAASLDHERARVRMLRARLARARQLLERQLVNQYEAGSPDLVGVVLESHGFTDLLERITFLRDAEHQQQHMIAVTRVAKAQADAAATHLAKLESTDQQLTTATALRVRALAGMNSLLQSRRSALAAAQALQSRDLSASRSRAGQLRGEISHLEAQQAAAAQATAAPSGSSLGSSAGWAIPYSIVLCESGGQNLPPNSAGASGYYQILPSTWKLFGGSGPAAYLASKGEQDAVAARIWNGGAGASNWVCAAIVGIG